MCRGAWGSGPEDEAVEFGGGVRVGLRSGGGLVAGTGLVSGANNCGRRSIDIGEGLAAGVAVAAGFGDQPGLGAFQTNYRSRPRTNRGISPFVRDTPPARRTGTSDNL